MRALGLLVGLLVGCGPSEERFAATLAELQCARFADCDQLDLVAPDEQTCIDNRTEQVLSIVTNAACSYDPAAARTCLRELREDQDECDQTDLEQTSCAVAKLCAVPEDDTEG